LLVLKYIFDPALRGRLEEIFLMFRDLAEAETALEYLRTVLYYIGKASAHLQPDEMVTIVQQTLTDEGNEIMQTVADYWIEQGIEQGRIQNLQENILDLLRIRFELTGEEVAERITAVTDPTILRQLHRRAATAETAVAFLDALTKLENSR
jgi:hypothetical protein